MKKQNITQLSIALIIIVLVGYISSFVFTRFDLTSEKRYTLSPTTQKFLSNLDDNIYIKVYLHGDDLPVRFKRMQKSIKELLDEFKVYAGNKLEYEFINPTANADKKVRFEIYKQLYHKGISPIEAEEINDEGKTSQKMVFPSSLLIYKGKELGINLLKSDARFQPDGEVNVNNSINALEYEFTNGMRKLSIKKKRQIAFIEGHGELSELELVDISRIWAEYYDVRRGAIGGKTGVLDNFEAIVIAKPTRAFSENDKYVIDQYIMQGGKVIWLLDGAQVNIDSLERNGQVIAMPLSLNLEDQLFKYGVRINSNLIQDWNCAPIGLAKGGDSGRPQINLYPWYYYPLIGLHSKHVISKYLDLVKVQYASSLDTVGLSSEIKKTLLLKSSESSLLTSVPNLINLNSIQKKKKRSDFTQKHKALAVLLEGKFESVFKNRTAQNQKNFKAKSEKTKMLVISGADLIRNEIAADGKPYPLGFERFSRRLYAGNSEFLLNAINYLCDDEGFMDVRSRELKIRLLNKKKVTAEKTFWQWLNVLLPAGSIGLLGLLVFYVRKKKYSVQSEAVS